jgi:hypothetical protein
VFSLGGLRLRELAVLFEFILPLGLTVPQSILLIADKVIE